MKKTAIYGGTFNPIHNGHIIALSALLDSGNFDEIHLMPSAIPPFKRLSDKEDFHRMEMIRSVAKQMPEIVLNELETTFDETSYTYLTLTHLKKVDPNTSYYWAIGYDNLYMIEQWKSSVKLLSEFSLVVLNRGGFDQDEATLKMNELKKNFGTEIIVVNMPNIEIASSKIRERASIGNSLYGYVPDSVSKYISKHKLYLD